MISERMICVVCESRMRPLFSRGEYRYERCDGCGHVVTVPYPPAGSLLEHYARGFRDVNYRTMRVHHTVYQRAMADMVHLLKEYLSTHKKQLDGMRVLDVGCFTGEVLELLRDAGARAVGVELQPEAVAIARQRTDATSVVCGDILNETLALPYPSYDCICALGLLEHVKDPIGLLQRFHSLLQPGGTLMIQTPNAGSWCARLMGRFWLPYTPVEHIHLFSRRSMCEALQRHGYAVQLVRAHVKRLSVAYVYEMLQRFGPLAHRVFAPLYHVLPLPVKRLVLPWYIGEMIIIAERV